MRAKAISKGIETIKMLSGFSIDCQASAIAVLALNKEGTRSTQSCSVVERGNLSCAAYAQMATAKGSQQRGVYL